MFRGILLLLITAFIVVQLNGQSQIEAFKSVIPPSPNAASLGKYADWPVSLFTGIPSVNIPLYEVKGRSLSLPISLNYHASGIRVSDIASWVGLGWSLDAGGVITRSVRGLADDDPSFGYLKIRQDYINPADLFSPTTDAALNENYVIQSAKNTIDTQPDLYMLNAMGRSYKLYFSADGTIVTEPYSQVNIIFDYALQEWDVTLEDGTVLTFGGQWKEQTLNAGIDAFYSSWYLKSIITPTHDEIQFTYSGFTNIDQSVSIYETDYLQKPGTYLSKSLVSSLRGQKISALYINTIESSSTRVEFGVDPAAREDLQNGRALSEIKIFDKKLSAYSYRYKFTYEYSQAEEGVVFSQDIYAKKRLRLARLEKLSNVRSDGSTASADVWSFVYNSKKLPSRLSFAQDYWGFYNGKTLNETLLPFMEIYEGTRFDPPTHKIGDRSSDPTYMKAEILEKIIYPTGGSSTFEYDAITDVVTEHVYSPKNVTQEISIEWDQDPSTMIFTRSDTITITRPQYITFNLGFAAGSSYLNSLGAGSIVTSISITTLADPNNAVGSLSCRKEENSKTSDPIYLQAGTYMVNLRSETQSPNDFYEGDYLRISGGTTYLKDDGIQTFEKPIGGLRIRRLRFTDDITNLTQTKVYEYSAPVYIAPFDTHSLYLTDLQEIVTVDRDVDYYEYWVRHSATQNSLGDNPGGIIGFGEVKVLYGEDGSGGYSISKFSTMQDEGIEPAKIFPYPPTCSVAWRRGLLLEQTDYMADDTPVHKVVNNYDFDSKASSIIGFKAGYFRIQQSSYGYDEFSDINRAEIRIRTEAVKLLSTSRTVYWLLGDHLKSSVNTEYYYYDNPDNLRATRVENVDSKGSVKKQIIRTPLERQNISGLSAEASAAIDYMLANHIIEPVLESEEYTGTSLIQKMRTDFKLSGGMGVPASVWIQYNSGLLENRMQYVNYDSYGNLCEQTKAQDAPVAYVWGYNFTYPVAEVKNATYQEIVNVLGQSVIDGLNSNPGTDAEVRLRLAPLRGALPKAQITTLTYDPIKGATSITDVNNVTTYYEYDAFGRLAATRDADGNLVQAYEYKFKTR